MPKIFIDDLTSKMVLEEPVKDQHGLLLFQKGIVVTENIIKTLREWEVFEVSIEGDDHEQTSSIDPLILKFAKIEIQDLFCNNIHRGPFTSELIRHITHRLAVRCSKGMSNES